LTKPVRSVLQTGQTGFSQKTPKDQQRQKLSKRTPNVTKLGPRDFLGKEQHACQKSSPTATVTKNWSDLSPKPVRPVSPRQTGKTQPAETTSSSNQSISRLTQRNATKLRGKADYLLGNLYLKGSIPKCIQREESKVNYQEHLFSSSSKNHQIEAVSEGLLEQDHQAKRHKVLIRDIQQESLKKRPQNFSTEIPRKGSENHQKGKTGETQSSLEEPC
jgi:ribosomal protein L25 (general stress protein Ctc)